MDPLSIAAASLSIAKICGTVGFELTKFIQNSDLVGPAVAGLQADITSFETVLGLLNETLNDENVKAWVSSSGRIGTYWYSLSLSLEDAKGTLKSLEEIVSRLKKPAKILETTRKQLRLQLAADEIVIYRQQIVRFKDTIQVILNTTTIWHQASDKGVSESVVPRLDETQQMIRLLGMQFNERIASLQHMLQSQSSIKEDQERPITEQEEYQTLDNLRNCLKGAASVITSASTAMGRHMSGGASTVYGSDFGDVFPAAPSDLTLNWIEDNTITESDEGYATRSEVSRNVLPQEYQPLEPIEEPDFDQELELEMMEACYQHGLECLAQGNLEDAERFLRNCADGFMDNDEASVPPQQAPFIIDAMATLGTILQRQSKWKDLQHLIKRKLYLQSRTQMKDEEGQLADKLLLSQALIMCEEYKEALLYCRSAEVAYRKLGARGLDGRISALKFIGDIQEVTGRQREAERCQALVRYLAASKGVQKPTESAPVRSTKPTDSVTGRRRGDMKRLNAQQVPENPLPSPPSPDGEDPQAKAEQKVREKEAILRREEEKLREIEEKVQREINEKRQELLAREAQLKEIEARMLQELEREERESPPPGPNALAHIQAQAERESTRLERERKWLKQGGGLVQTPSSPPSATARMKSFFRG